MSYLIGIDGGATKTAAILADMEGNILNKVVAPASNYHAVGREKAGQAMREAVTRVVEGAGKSPQDCTLAIFGLSGLNNDHDESIYRSLIEPINIGGDIRIENDIVIAWAAATACQPGVVVIAGTGSSAFGINRNGDRVKTLGWDYIVADQGSGYWVGLKGMQAAFKAWDGRSEDGQMLLESLLDHLNVKDGDEALLHIYSRNFLDDMKTRTASFAKRVSECADAGDIAARLILHQAGEELGNAVATVIRRLNMQDEDFIVGRVGSTFNSGKYLLEPFEKTIHDIAPGVDIQVAAYRAQVGALIYGYNMLGSLTDDLLEKLPDRHEFED